MRVAFSAFAAALALGLSSGPAIAAEIDLAQPVAQSGEFDSEVPRAEAALLRTIWRFQSGAPDYAAMERILADTVKARPELVDQVKAYGAPEDVEYLGAVNGARHFKVAFAKVETHWFIALSPTGKIATLVFREG